MPYEAPEAEVIEMLKTRSVLEIFSLETDFDDFDEGEEL